ncbi:DUF2087 domain-containing protein [Phenylobacterium sp.]|uniref:DUF2087 domain-containing protein n=1 Tax=Phenylobacterium sp. TaxID=1871053 RepID=UPI0035B0C8F3
MSKDQIPYSAADISALAKSLRGQLAGRERPPGHVEMLNMLARAAGARNFQHFRAQAAHVEALEPAQAALAAPAEMGPARVEAALRCFDARGRLARWPAKPSLQALCLWGLWARIPAGRSFTEGEVNALIKEAHGFGDHALLRRELFNRKLVSRTIDCRDYRRIERRPPPEALALIRRLPVGGGKADA